MKTTICDICNTRESNRGYKIKELVTGKKAKWKRIDICQHCGEKLSEVAVEVSPAMEALRKLGQCLGKAFGTGEGKYQLDKQQKECRKSVDECIINKVTNAEIVERDIAGKPYYEIKYNDVSDGKCHVGYGSYNLQNVQRWLKECFEIVN